MNSIYLYDGSFSSLIALIVELRKIKKVPNDIKTKDYNFGLFDDVIYLSGFDKEKNIYCLKKSLSKRMFLTIYYVYLSENMNKEMIIYGFINYALIYGEKVYFYRRIDCINDSIKIASYVSREAHKLKGFLRFKEMRGNFLYGVIAPTNNIIEILAQHFKRRLCNEMWIIKDEKRNLYVLYDKKKLNYLTDEDIVELNLCLNDKEIDIQDLWKAFFKSISIDERKNRKCQMNFMPKKYWGNIIEMEDE